ncbi:MULTISPECIES: hypothetical protein [unclassified Bradyrhizobium]|uniref:hypothetical protein n=1 Tax=unclassified Bradyrhizobium TaxID=2631580 RepID=UPI00211DDD35|nr:MULTISPECIES: hypothetical protein [unclassified Bradyrhizobium]
MAWSRQAVIIAQTLHGPRHQAAEASASAIPSGSYMKVLMEPRCQGVETEAELSCPRAEGCHEGQGFLFSKARPNIEIVSLLAAQRGIGGDDAALVA